MAIYFPEKRAVWLQVPKTGGLWVRQALLASGLPVVSIDDDTYHNVNLHCLAHEVPYRCKCVFGFVRHPLSWYESWWKYQAGDWSPCEQKPWHPQRGLALRCCDDDFSGFIQKCIEYEPAYVSRMYEWYFGPPRSNLATFVGRYENLYDDLVTMLDSVGYSCDQYWLATRPPVNVSPARCGLPQWRPDLKEQILRLERPAIERFYT